MKNKIEYNKLEIKEEKEDIMAIDKTRLVKIKKGFKVFCGKTDYVAAERRCEGPFYNKAIYLSKTYDWVLGVDNDDVLCLVPLKKRVE